MANFGEHIKARREQLGLRQDEIAFRVGKAQSWYSRLEKGELVNLPEPETLRELGCVLELSMPELLEVAGYLSPDDREHVLINPFGVDDPRWAVVEALKRHPLTSEQSQAVQALLPFFSPGD